MKIKIKLITKSNTKLALVKLIKECSGLGLKESKDLCDFLHDHPHTFLEVPIKVNNDNHIDYRKKFIDELKQIDGEFVVIGGSQWERDFKMLKLGIAEKSEYLQFIKDNVSLEKAFDRIFNKLSKEDLMDIINNLENY